jgi:phosphatidylserine/phosphatidylglycerophosphate/cardiolipin synthase-like enzyme
VSSVQLLGTGPEFIRKGIRGIEPVIEEAILSARSDIHILAYLFTPRATGFLDLLEGAAKKSVKIRILVNRLDRQHVRIRSRLMSLRKSCHTVDVASFVGEDRRQLHAKVVVADRKKAIIGSANFSWGGMVANYEIGVLIEGQAAWKMAELIDSMIAGSTRLGG